MSVSFDDGPTPADRMRRHFRDDDHLYAHLLRSMADDWEDGGPVKDIFAGYERAPSGSVIQLRLLAGLFRIVLTGRAPELERFYPCLGGTSGPGDAWPAVREVLASHVEELHEALLVAPQTNEVGRSNALLVGIFAAVAHTGLSSIRLLEPGASAGLNLLVDRIRFVNQGWVFGPEESPVVLAGGVIGAVLPAPFQVIERRGCDLSPIDLATPEGRLRLRSFVWPFHLERHERLSAALRIAEHEPPVVDRAPAGTWLADMLHRPAATDVLTVVWQSVTRLYWPPEQTAQVDAAVSEAASHSAVVHVSMEFPGLHDDHASAELTVTYPGAGDDPGRLVRLASVGDHGFPVSLGE